MVVGGRQVMISDLVERTKLETNWRFIYGTVSVKSGIGLLICILADCKTDTTQYPSE